MPLGSHDKGLSDTIYEICLVNKTGKVIMEIKKEGKFFLGATKLLITDNGVLKE